MTRLNVVGGWMVKPIVASVMLGVVSLGNFWPVAPIRKALLDSGAKPRDVRAHLELSKEAARVNDYRLAESEFSLVQEHERIRGEEKILGVSSEMEGVRQEVFPEEVIREEIAVLEKVAGKVNTRDAWLKLAVLHWRLFDEQKAREYWQKAWLVDPNNGLVNQVGKLLGV